MAYLPKQSYLFAPDNWDAGWRAALRGSSTTPVNIAVLGDSFTYGHSGVTNFMTKPWWTLLRADLLTKYAAGGDFWPSTYSQEFLTQFGNTFNGTPPFTSINATNIAWGNGQGFVNLVYWTATTAANLWTFTTPYACTDIDIVTLDFATGSWTYTVDGGGTNTVTIASTTSPMTMRRTQITGLSNTTHTVVCTGCTGAFSHMLMGVAAYQSRTVGLRFAWTAVSGASVPTYVQGTIPTLGQSYVWQGRSGASTTGFGFPSQPNLAIIALGINDCANGYGLEGFQGGLRKICQALRRGNPDCSILFMANSNPDGDNSDVTTPFVNSICWPMFIDRDLNIAIDFNCALVNFNAKWGETGNAQGFQATTDPHPLDAGHVNINVTNAALL